MKNFVCFTFLFICLHGTAQIFEGKLVYSYQETRSKEDKEKAAEILGDEIVTELSRGTMEFIVRGSQVKGTCFGSSGKVIFIEKQNENTPWLLTSDGREINLLNYTDYDKLMLAEKTNETRAILGQVCRKYIYFFDNPNGRTTVVHWIAENLKYKKQAALKKIYSRILSDEGLIMERTMQFNDMSQTLTLKELSLYKVEDQELEKGWNN
ncbi:MAG: hypothetical protein ACK4TA_14135 [Saprospiraceae bacterium]